ncbi:hypothetical protein LguiB_016808 [Lonicera macranthoides]
MPPSLSLYSSSSTLALLSISNLISLSKIFLSSSPCLAFLSHHSSSPPSLTVSSPRLAAVSSPRRHLFASLPSINFVRLCCEIWQVNIAPICVLSNWISIYKVVFEAHSQDAYW